MNENYKEWSCDEVSKSAELRLAMGDWVDKLAPWQVFATLTFVWPVSQDSARRLFERFMRKNHPDVAYFYALEKNPSREGHHVHGVMWRKEIPHLKDWWKLWFEKFGRCRYEFLESREDVVNYVSKYVTKEASWWQWDVQAFTGIPFKTSQKNLGDIFLNSPSQVAARRLEADRLIAHWGKSSRAPRFA
jgi:hypothetical protein